MQMCGLCFGVGEAEEPGNAPGVFCTVWPGGRSVVVFSGGRRNSPEGAVRSFGGGKEKWKRASAWRSSGAGGRGAELRGWVGKFVRRGDGGRRRFLSRKRVVRKIRGPRGEACRTRRRLGRRRGADAAAKASSKESAKERGLGHRLRRQGTSKAFGSGKRAPVTRLRLPCGGQKKALPESRQGLFDASETEITPCLRQCSRRCGRFPVLHRWE